MEKVDMEKTHHKTKHGFISEVKILNEVGHTHFCCANWSGLCKAYGFEEGMRINLGIGITQDDPEHDKDIWVDLDMIPILPLCEFAKQIC